MSTLSKNTRVFRQHQTIPPTTAVLKAFSPDSTTASALAATTLGAGSGSIEEEAPAYNPTYPFNTILVESESGHLIEIDDTPGAERVHVFHRSGSHIELRPDGGVKYKTVKTRQDITIGDNEVMISGDCNIVVEGGYTLHVRKGELIIDAKDDAAINVKGTLKITADDIEMKASKRIFLNSPMVDIGGMSPGGMPMMSLPMGIVPYPTPSIPPIFVPTVKLPLSPAGMTSMSKLSKQIKDGTLPAAAGSNSVSPGTVASTAASAAAGIIGARGLASAMNSILSKDALDASGEPAFSKLQEQPGELPLSNPSLYRSTQVLGAGDVIGPDSTPKGYQQLRGRAFDTPEDVGNIESYNAHINLSIELGDFTQDQKTAAGTILYSDTTAPAKEPPPPQAFSLPSGGTVQHTNGTKTLVGVSTKFTEDVSEGDTLFIADADVVVESIASDTELNLTQPWSGTTGSGAVKMYRLRPLKEFFGTFAYADTARLGTSGLTLQNLMVNFMSPVVEVPQINATMLVMGAMGGASSADGPGDSSECGVAAPVPDPGIERMWNDFKATGVDLTTLDGAGRFVEYVIANTGPEYGHITKSGAQTKYNNHAVDAIYYRSPTPLYNGGFYQVIDFIINAGIAAARPGWQPVCAPDLGNPPSNWGGKG